MPTAGFGPTICAADRPQAYALDRPATGIGGLCQVHISKYVHLGRTKRVKDYLQRYMYQHTQTHRHTKPPYFDALISRYVCRHAYPIQYIVITTAF